MTSNYDHPGEDTHKGSPNGPAGIVGGISAILCGIALYALTMKLPFIPVGAMIGYAIGMLITEYLLAKPKSINKS